jgi:hypothetical protein
VPNSYDIVDHSFDVIRPRRRRRRITGDTRQGRGRFEKASPPAATATSHQARRIEPPPDRCR